MSFTNSSIQDSSNEKNMSSKRKMKWSSVCIKDIEHECLVFYSYLSKNRRRGSVVGFGECNWRTGGNTRIRAHDKLSKF